MGKLSIVVVLVILSTSLVSALGFQKDATYLGPTIGFAFGGEGIGVNGEYAIDKNWGIGGEISYAGFTDHVTGVDYAARWKYRFIGVLAAGSYHFILKDKPQLDPYLKAGLGYFHWSADYSDNFGNMYSNLYSAGYSSGVGIEGEAGGRYFFKPNMALRVQIGYPFYLGVGLDFVKLR